MSFTESDTKYKTTIAVSTAVEGIQIHEEEYEEFKVWNPQWT